MHNLHLIVIDAVDAEEAIKRVRGEIDGWGSSDDNYYSIVGTIDENNEVTEGEDVDCNLAENGLTSIQKINDYVKGWMAIHEEANGFAGTEYSDFMEIVRQIRDTNNVRELAKPDNSSKWYSAKRFCEFMYQLSRVENVEKFNVLEDEFFPWHLDENGVTNLAGIYSDDEQPENNRKFVVIIDMHS